MRKASLLLGLLLIATGLAHAAAQAKLSIYGQPILNVDPLKDSTTGWIKIRNEGPAGTPPVPLYLTATTLSIKSPAKSLAAQIILTADKKFLAANEELWVKLDVSGVDEPGQWETTIQNQYVDIGTVKIVRPEAPFHLTLDVADQAAPELTFLRNKPASFGLKNDDGRDYLITWEYTIDGQTVRSSDPGQDCRAPKSGSESSAIKPPSSFASACSSALTCAVGSKTENPPGALLVPAHGFKAASFCPLHRWFGSRASRFAALFKDQVGEGRLVINRLDCSGCTLTKTFNIKTHLAGSTGIKREIYADLWILAFLFAGGIISVALRSTFPNNKSKSTLKIRLMALRARISTLSRSLASRIRVLAGLRQGLLTQRLIELSWADPDFTTVLASIDQGATRLESRLQIAESLGTTREWFEMLRPQRLRPSRIVEIENIFEIIIALIKKAASSTPEDEKTDLQKARDLINGLLSEFEAVGTRNNDIANDLTECAAQSYHDFSTGPIGHTATWENIKSALCEAFAIVSEIPIQSPPVPISPEEYVKVDRACFQLKLAKAYVQRVDCLQQNDPLRAKILSHQHDLLALLSSDNGQTLYLAWRMLQQIEEGWFGEDIGHALQDATHLRITQDQVVITPYEPCVFKLELLNRALDCSTAREDWICQWTFRHLGEPPLTEEGWEVTHYFQKADTYTFDVNLTHRPTGVTLPVLDPRYLKAGRKEMAIEVYLSKVNLRALLWHIVRWKKIREAWGKYSIRNTFRLWDRLHFILALLIALLGMLAGAKDQILKMDFIPALIAIFFLGFNADTIKNLLTNTKTETSSSSTPQTRPG